jgi:hypothetical protein
MWVSLVRKPLPTTVNPVIRLNTKPNQYQTNTKLNQYQTKPIPNQNQPNRSLTFIHTVWMKHSGGHLAADLAHGNGHVSVERLLTAELRAKKK